MAGSQNAEDNPVAINVTAMVDVIFCLCLFFMCSLHFKQLEGKLESWLPRDHGNGPSPAASVVLEEIRILMRWEPGAARTIRSVGHRPPVRDDAELVGLIRDMAADFRHLGRSQVPLKIDATPDVPWKDVVWAMDLCKGAGLGSIELVEPIGFGSSAEPSPGPAR